MITIIQHPRDVGIICLTVLLAVPLVNCCWRHYFPPQCRWHYKAEDSQEPYTDVCCETTGSQLPLRACNNAGSERDQELKRGNPVL